MEKKLKENDTKLMSIRELQVYNYDRSFWKKNAGNQPMWCVQLALGHLLTWMLHWCMYDRLKMDNFSLQLANYFGHCTHCPQWNYWTGHMPPTFTPIWPATNMYCGQYTSSLTIQRLLTSARDSSVNGRHNHQHAQWTCRPHGVFNCVLMH